MTKTLSRGLSLALVLLFANSQGCDSQSDDHDDGHAHAGAAGAAAGASTLYEGGVTDESLDSIKGVAAKVDDARAAAITAPGEGQTLAASTPFTFTWSGGLSRAPSAPSSPAAPPSRWVELRKLLTPINVAHAHGTPYSGVAYLLTLSTSSGAVVEVHTSKTTYTPDQATWSLLSGAGSPITAQLVTARLQNNLLSGDGPFLSSNKPTFSVKP